MDYDDVLNIHLPFHLRAGVRFHYDDIRMLGFAPMGSVVHCVVFIEEDDHYHIISLRKADRNEVREYATKI
jgi:uncharacterized protein